MSNELEAAKAEMQQAWNARQAAYRAVFGVRRGLALPRAVSGVAARKAQSSSPAQPPSNQLRAALQVMRSAEDAFRATVKRLTAATSR
jgi:hypothetical protein